MVNFVNEIMHVADTIARERGLSKSIVLDIVKQAIAVVAKRRHGEEHDIEVELDQSGHIRIYRNLLVVEEEADCNEFLEISLSEIKENPDLFVQNIDEISLGDRVQEELPPMDINRVSAKTMQQIVVAQMQEAERKQHYEDMKGLEGTIIVVTVARYEKGNVICLVNSAVEAILGKKDLIQGEVLRVNDRIKVYVKEVSLSHGYQVVVSRSCSEFLELSMKSYIPEVANNVVQTKAVARDPGMKAKVAVYSAERGVDPVGSCVGIGGARMNEISKELHGERVEVVHYSDDLVTFVARAMSPAVINTVIIKDDGKSIEVVVEESQLSLAIGKKGQNVRLASELVGYNIDVLSEQKEKERRQEEFKLASDNLMNQLNIDRMIAHLLIAKGLFDVQSIADTSIEDLMSIEGFGEDNIAEELKNRALEIVQSNQYQSDKQNVGGIDSRILDLPEISDSLLKVLMEKGIKDIDDIADLSSDELIEIVGEDFFSDKASADSIIMSARKHWFDKEE